MIRPSIMCCKLKEYSEWLNVFEKNNIESIHFDVFDGHYVDNIMLGTNYFENLKNDTNLPIDIHLITYKPERYFNMFEFGRGDSVSFHPESTSFSYKLLQDIKSRGAFAGIALSPDTPLNYIIELKDCLDFVLVMCVNPGFSGQKLLPNAIEKIKRLNELKKDYKLDFKIVPDGNTTLENSKLMYENGANSFVVGTSSLLKNPKYFNKNYQKYIDFVKGGNNE